MLITPHRAAPTVSFGTKFGYAEEARSLMEGKYEEKIAEEQDPGKKGALRTDFEAVKHFKKDQPDEPMLYFCNYEYDLKRDQHYCLVVGRGKEEVEHVFQNRKRPPALSEVKQAFHILELRKDGKLEPKETKKLLKAIQGIVISNPFTCSYLLSPERKNLDR